MPLLPRLLSRHPDWVRRNRIDDGLRSSRLVGKDFFQLPDHAFAPALPSWIDASALQDTSRCEAVTDKLTRPGDDGAWKPTA